MSARYDAANSPSVALEKGLYRLKPPARRRLGSSPSPSPLGRRKIKKPSISHIGNPTATFHVAGIVFGLVVLICLFVLASRWEILAISRIPSTLRPKWKRPSDLSEQPEQSFPTRLISPNFAPHHDIFLPEQKYLAYLPHSGFNNQRVALENAITLAHMLNRTLIVPPIRLGLPIRYVEFDKLYRNLALSSKYGLEHCLRAQIVTTFVPQECTGYSEFTMIPWSALINIHTSELSIRLFERWDSSTAWLRYYLNISERDTAYIKDDRPYRFQLFDDPDDAYPLKSKYSEKLDVTHLREAYSNLRLLHVGTLFGTTRLHLTRPENVHVRKKARESMVFSNELLLQVSHSVKDVLDAELGGSGYVGIHLRLGDGSFQREGDANSRLLWWTLVTKSLGLSVEQAGTVEASAMGWSTRSAPPEIKLDQTALRFPHGPVLHLNSSITPPQKINSLKCRGSLYHRELNNQILLNTPVFIATDSKAPRADPSLRLFLRTLPCSFFLSDFAESHLTPLLSPTLVNDDDGLPLGKFLLPFVDAMIAAMGRDVIGTPRSTFSRFTVDVLHRVYHGWPIVERG